MDGLELALKCTSLIKRTTSRPNDISTDLTAALAPDLPPTLASHINSCLIDDTEETVEESEDLLEHFSDDDGLLSLIIIVSMY